MKIYFTGSLHNKNININLYNRIVAELVKLGHEVKSDHILSTKTVDIEQQSALNRQIYYRKLNSWITRADAIVCEVSYPSTINIGHEITLALDKGKPTVALYESGREPGLLQGLVSEKLLLMEYNRDNLEEVVGYGLEEAGQQVDVRFNFFISPKIGNYLDWVSKKKRLPRAVYLRKLIEEDMKKNKDFEG